MAFLKAASSPLRQPGVVDVADEALHEVGRHLVDGLSLDEDVLGPLERTHDLLAPATGGAVLGVAVGELLLGPVQDLFAVGCPDGAALDVLVIALALVEVELVARH